MTSKWPLVTLGDLCSKVTDGSHNPPKGIAESDYLMLSSRDIQDDNIAPVSPRYLTEDEFHLEHRRTDLTPGDVLLTIVGTIGRSAIYSGVPKLVTLQRSVAVLTPKCDRLDARYLMYFFHGSTQYFEDKAQGTAQKGFYLGQLREMRMPLPPLDEQKRIVAKLDKAFSEIEKLEKSVTSIKLQSSFLRTSIYDKYFNFSDTRRVKLGEIANFEGGQQPPKSEFIFEPKNGFIRFIQIRDFKSDKNITYIPDSPRNRICKESDILIGRYGASVGQILTGLAGAYNVALMKLIPETNSFNTQYAFHYLQSFSFQSQLAKVSKRSAQAGFSKDDISSFLVPLPDLETQVSIVTEIESANLLLDGYESRLNSKGQLLRDFYKSLLNSAFSGDF